MTSLLTPSRGPTSSESTSMSQEKVEQPPSENVPQHFTRLSPTDLTIIYQSLGIPTDPENHSPILRKSSIYPPKGLPEGLYKEVLRSRLTSKFKYYFVAIFFNLSLLTQLILGASMTALSATLSSTSNLPIIILAASNTVIAGLLALMHNSGLPERYKNDYSQFDNVELKIRELVEAGVVKAGVSRDDAVEECFKDFRDAKKTVEMNRPSTYAPSAITAVPPKQTSSKGTNQSV